MKFVFIQLKEIKLFKYFFFIIFVFSILSVNAHQFQKDDININHPYIKFTLESGPAAGYMTIVNMGDEVENLIGVKADFATAELHYSQIINGTAIMSEVEFIEIPPQIAKSLKPGSYHIMFSNFSIELVEGIKLDATLVFKNVGDINVVFEVENQESNEHTTH